MGVKVWGGARREAQAATTGQKLFAVITVLYHIARRQLASMAVDELA